MRIAVLVAYCQQVGPDSWQSGHEVFEASERTTIGELIEWQKRINPRGRAGRGDGFEPMSVVPMDGPDAARASAGTAGEESGKETT